MVLGFQQLKAKVLMLKMITSLTNELMANQGHRQVALKFCGGNLWVAKISVSYCFFSFNSLKVFHHL